MTEAGERGATAHVLRRVSFGPFPGDVRDALDAHGSASAVLDAAIGADPVPLAVPAGLDLPYDKNNEEYGNERLVSIWFDRMARSDVGLHDKMVWFWHSHFPIGFTKVPGYHCWQQLQTFHAMALGNFRELTRAMVKDAGVVQYLDASGSSVPEPNENLARELMELFTLGRGHYTEADVRAAAFALAGWNVSETGVRAEFDPVSAYHGTLTFLGRTGRFDVDAVVDQIFTQPSVAPFVTAKLARFFLGDVASPARIDEWADLFRSGDFEVRPVVEAILRSEEFTASRMRRPRSGIEWLCASVRATGMKFPESYWVQEFAQVPFYPPNVSGWSNRWLTRSSLYARAAFLYKMDLPPRPLGSTKDPVSAALERCGLFEVSDGTRGALEDLRRSRASQVDLLRAALVSPEFALS